MEHVAVILVGGALVSGIIAASLHVEGIERKKARDEYWRRHWEKYQMKHVKKHGKGPPVHIIVKNLLADLELTAVFKPICRHGHQKCHCHNGG